MYVIKDPKHVHKHRLVIIITFIGILIVFGVWAVQLKQMFAQEAAKDLVRGVDDESTVAAQNYIDQLDTLVPGIEATFGDVIREQEQEVARIQAQQESEDLLADELMKRFEAQAKAEAEAQENQEAEEVTE